MSITDMRGADLRGYHTADQEEEGSKKSKLLAGTAVVLGFIAVGAYAYTSHNLLPSAPVKQQSATSVSQPVAMTPPSNSAATQPDLATQAPQTAPAPEAQAVAPEVNAPAPQAAVKAQSSAEKVEPVKRVSHTRAHTSEVQKPVSAQSAASPDMTQSPAVSSQIVTPGVSTPGTDTTTPYTAAPVTAPQNMVTPQTMAPDSTNTTVQQPQQTAPDQSAPQAQPQPQQ